MRIPTRFFLLPLLVFPAVLAAQTVPATASDSATPATIRWNRLVPKFMAEAVASRRAARAALAGDSAALRRIAQAPLPMTFDIYPVLSVAQYAAANSAREKRDASSAIAVASASAAVLANLFQDPTVRASIAGELARDIERVRAGAQAGRSLGDEAAARVMARAPVLSLVAPWTGTIPKGPGMWYSAPGVPPLGVTLATSRTWLLDSTSQYRPVPPPAHGSATWEAAMEEVRRVARDRTPEQTQIAQRWNSRDPMALWNDTASSALSRHRASEAQAARVLAVMNAAGLDASIACFEAKYHYWTIRPSQADSTLVLADSVGLPNFPSFPSGHACTAGAFDVVLGHFFPNERARFTRMAEEQAMSRLYGGIHYRFDNDGGLELGRIVARHAIERERRGALDVKR